MRIPKRLQAACIAFVLAGAAAAQQQLPIPVADALQRADIPAAAVGLHVQEVGGGPVLAASNESVPFNPASVMKLVTSNAALEVLGPTFTWKTQAYMDGALRGDVLHGDLIIKGSGDPKLVIENFWLFLRRIRAKGIREIRGNLLLDRSAFEELPHDSALFDGDPLKPYNVGPDALLLNYKALAFRFQPNEARTSVGMAVEPPLAAYPIHAPRLANGDCGDWRGKMQPSIDGAGARFDGVFSAACGEKIWYVHPYQMSHTQYFSLAFRRLWADLGGSWKGEAKSGIMPPGARLAAEWESAALSEVIRDINKYSNNVMARQLLLTLANQVLRMPANTEHGAAVVRNWLSNKGIDAPELSIENGSGLSRTERVSPLTLARMLAASFQSPTMPEFMASLPLAGYDGTMRRRVNGRTVAGNAHIKTGTLHDVRAIAGYVLAASGKRYAVVCMINHPNATRGQEAQDALLQWVYDRG
ncbi:MAG: D-alanyl-D-alanine carboxypeptidase/D-alanyl-D-alanine endopeptidase [Noviherbaspirillum sp.]